MEKQRIDIGVVVLHYNNAEDTIECVQSFLENLDTKNFKILVFDNCSPNNSGKKIKEKFDGIENVDVYLNDKNLGFGGGNNKGIEILRARFEPKFLVLSNNDIVLIEKHFFKKIDEEYNISHFAELGPMIITADGRCDSNPIFDKPYLKNVAIDELKEMKKLLVSYKHHYVWLHNFLRRLKFRISRKTRAIRRGQLRKNKEPGNFLLRRENIVCHGCFMVFSQEFFKYYEGIDLHSFMYAEEDILFAQIAFKNLKTIYSPNIQIYHKEDGSLKATFKESRKRKIFVLEKSIEANEGYIQFLNELEEKGFKFNEGD